MTRLYVPVANVVCWGLVVIVWVVAALRSHSRAPRVRIRSRSRPAVVIAVAAVCAAVAVLWRPYCHDLTVEAMWVRFLGLAVLVTSTILAVWARLSVGVMWSLDARWRSWTARSVESSIPYDRFHGTWENGS
jgi:hypothetical protein